MDKDNSVDFVEDSGTYNLLARTTNSHAANHAIPWDTLEK